MNDDNTVQWTLDDETIDELINLRTSARLSAGDFSEAIKAQSEKHGISAGALRKYVCAKESDKLAALDAEAEDLARLMLRDEVAP